MRIIAVCLAWLAGSLLSACVMIGDISEPTDDSVPIEGDPLQEITYCIADRNHQCNAPKSGPTSSTNSAFVAAASSGASLSYLGKTEFKALIAKTTRKIVFDRDSVIPKSLHVAGPRFRNPSDSEYESYVRADNFLRNNAVQQDIVSAIAFAAGMPADYFRSAEEGSKQFRMINLEREAAMTWASDLYDVTGNDGFAWAEYVNFARADALREANDSQFVNTLVLAAESSKFLKVYLRAFFRNGKFASIRLDASDIENEIRAQLEAIPANVPDRAKLIKDLTAKMLRAALRGDPVDGTLYTLIGEISDASFVSRGGVSYSFPAITVDVNPLASSRIDTNDVDYTDVGANIVRVAIEAVGDAFLNVPADASSTARKHKDRLLPTVAQSEENIYMKTNDVADKADGLAGATAGRFIRGVSWFALNNEALAVLIETSLAVVARKGAEKLAWCYFKCSTTAKNTPDFSELEIRYNEARALRLTIAAPRTD